MINTGEVVAVRNSLPKKVSNSTSGAQTEEHPAANTPSFTLPEVLMLDSYTQTNDDDRMSTLPIRCKKQTMEAQTDPVPEYHQPIKPAAPPQKRVSFSIQVEPDHWQSMTSKPERKTSERRRPEIYEGEREIPVRQVSSEWTIAEQRLPVRDMPEKSRQAPTHVDKSAPGELPPRNNICRHGNERTSCAKCNDSVVYRKHRNPILEPTENELEIPKSKQESRFLPAPTTKPPLPAEVKDEGADSGQELDSPPPPVVSTDKLSKIKHLAKAKLKQIKSSKNSRRSVQSSLERHSPEHQAPEQPARTPERKQRRKPRVYNGVESFTLQDLPPLVDHTYDQRRQSYTDSEVNYGRSLIEVEKLKEEKRLVDVERAKQYIKHCIESPLTEGAVVSDSESYRHKSRITSKLPRSESLPRISEDRRRCGSEVKRRSRGIADDVESRKCVSDVASGRLQQHDVNYKAYINALERIVDSKLTNLVHTNNYHKH